MESRRHSWIQNSKIFIGRRESFDPLAPHTIMRPSLQNICHISNANDFLRFRNRFDDVDRYSCVALLHLDKNKSHREKPLKDAATDSPACWWNWSSLKFGTKLAIMHYRKTNLVQYELYCRVLFVKIRIFPKHPPILAFSENSTPWALSKDTVNILGNADGSTMMWGKLCRWNESTTEAQHWATVSISADLGRLPYRLVLSMCQDFESDLLGHITVREGYRNKN